MAQRSSGSQVRRRVLLLPHLSEEAVLLASIEALVDALTGFDPTYPLGPQEDLTGHSRGS